MGNTPTPQNPSGLFDWLANLLKKKSYKSIRASPTAMQFIGELSGDVAKAQQILLPLVTTDKGLNRAYLTGVKYDGDAKPRLAICLDTDTPPEQVIKTLATSCAQQRIYADILFFEDLTQTQLDKLKSLVKPFYDRDSQSK